MYEFQGRNSIKGGRMLNPRKLEIFKKWKNDNNNNNNNNKLS